MELRQLRYFCELATQLSFTRAAAKLHVSQPPLSFQIAQLEAELGARLFERSSRSVLLSEAGKAFLPHAQAVLARLEEGRSHVQRVASGAQGRVQLGLAGSHFLGPFPAFMAQFRRNWPEVELVLVEMQPAEQLQALRDGRLDACISRTAVSDALISSALLWRDAVLVALPADHRLAGYAAVRLAQLSKEEFVFLRLDSSRFAQRLFDACVQSGFTPRISQQVVEVPAVLSLVAAGFGVSLVPASLASLRTQGVHLSQLHAAEGQVAVNGDVHMVWRSGGVSAAALLLRQQLLVWAEDASNAH